MITYGQYLAGVNSTWNAQDPRKDQYHCLLGITSELGELVGWYKKIYGYGRKKDESWKAEVKGELGDITYFIVKLSDIINSDLIENYFQLIISGDYDNQLDSLKSPFSPEGKSAIPTVYLMLDKSLELMDTGSFTDEFQNNLGAIFSMLYQLCRREGFDLEDILIGNLAKLQARHGSSYNANSSVEEGRNRDNELDALK